MTDLERHYHVLGLEPGASAHEVKQAYRDLVKVWHPDRFAHDPRLQKKAEERIKEINTAYSIVQSAAPGSRPEEQPETSYDGDSGFRSPPPSPPPRRQPEAKKGFLSRELKWVLSIEIALLCGYVAYEMAVSPKASIDGTQARAVVSAATWRAEQLIDFLQHRDGLTRAQVIAAIKERWRAGDRELREKVQDLSEFLAREADSASVAPVAESGRDDVQPHEGLRSFPQGERKEDDEESKPGRKYFTVGSSPDDVLIAQGSPTGVMGTTWQYDQSTVHFVDKVVAGYSNLSGNLRVRLVPRSDRVIRGKHASFATGSTQDEVLAAQGTPTCVIGSAWRYDESVVTFLDERVASYSNASRNLKVRLH